MQTNVERGLIAAGLCAALFIFIFIAQRFLEKRRSMQVTTAPVAGYSKDQERVSVRGLDNMGMTKYE